MQYFELQDKIDVGCMHEHHDKSKMNLEQLGWLVDAGYWALLAHCVWAVTKQTRYVLLTELVC